MDRKKFIGSLFTLIYAPSILAEVKDNDFKILKQWQEVEYKTKRACCFKVPVEISEDEEIMFLLVKNECDKAKIDLSKPYRIETGYDMDDFTRNLLTYIVTQYN